MNVEKEMQATVDELNAFTKQLLKEVEGMKKNFTMVKWTRPTVEELLSEGHKWELWYAWKPVKDIHGKWHWFKEIYRMRGNTYVDQEDWAWYHYGTVFDIIKNT